MLNLLAFKDDTTVPGVCREPPLPLCPWSIQTLTGTQHRSLCLASGVRAPLFAVDELEQGAWLPGAHTPCGKGLMLTDKFIFQRARGSIKGNCRSVPNFGQKEELGGRVEMPGSLGRRQKVCGVADAFVSFDRGGREDPRFQPSLATWCARTAI